MSRKEKTGILELLKSLIKKPYYYISPCPVCQNRMTGRFIQFHRQSDVDWMINESLRKGELVTPHAGFKDLTENVYCLGCGHTWYEDVHIQLFTIDQINEEKKARHTSELLNQRYEELLQNEHQTKKGVITSIKKFVGPI